MSLRCRIYGKSDLVTVEFDASGKKQVNGNSKRLKESAHYPVQFGLELATLISPYGSPSASMDRGSSCFFLANVLLFSKVWIWTICSTYLKTTVSWYTGVWWCLMCEPLQLLPPALTLKDLQLKDSDPEESDDGAINDLIRGRDAAKWRKLL